MGGVLLVDQCRHNAEDSCSNCQDYHESTGGYCVDGCEKNIYHGWEKGAWPLSTQRSDARGWHVRKEGDATDCSTYENPGEGAGKQQTLLSNTHHHHIPKV